MPFAFSTRSRTELNLEMLVVAAMVASSDISSKFVASKRSHGVDVQRYCLEDRHAVRFVELNLEMVAVAAMLAASS
jgi:hypothetical protein